VKEGLPATVLALAARSRRVFGWDSGRRRLSTPALLVLVALIDQPGLTSRDLADRCGLPQNRTSEVLATLRDAGFVEDRDVGRFIQAGEQLTDDGIEVTTEFLAHAARALEDVDDGSA
jgi:DNA-binding IclR family transcriptional regulator